MPNQLIFRVILAATLALAAPLTGPAMAHETPTRAAASRPDFAGETASAEAREVTGWVLAAGDNRGRPFAIVDKKKAKVFVFDAQGRLIGATPALLGLARGDDSAPGVGDRPLSQIPPKDRTTPAGRFPAVLGHALGPNDVLWVDYGAALSLHRVLAAGSREHRLERLAATEPGDPRITFGCINVPVRFYDAVVHPAFAGAGGVVYILPEVKTIAEVFFSARPPGPLPEAGGVGG
jgi:hypothetical protein